MDVRLPELLFTTWMKKKFFMTRPAGVITKVSQQGRKNLNQQYLNMIKPYKLLIIIILFSSCSNGIERLRVEEKIINERVAKHTGEENPQLVLDTISGFDWDELLIIGPYVDVDTIANRSGYDLQVLPESTKSFDKLILLGFIDNKKAVRYMQLNRSNFHDSIFIQKGREYRFYPRKEAQLNLRDDRE